MDICCLGEGLAGLSIFLRNNKYM